MRSRRRVELTGDVAIPQKNRGTQTPSFRRDSNPFHSLPGGLTARLKGPGTNGSFPRKSPSCGSRVLGGEVRQCAGGKWSAAAGGG